MIFLIVIFVVQSEDFMSNFWSRIFLCKMFLNSLYFLDNIVKVLKMIILPYRVRFHILHSFKALWISIIAFKKFVSFRSSLVCEK